MGQKYLEHVWMPCCAYRPVGASGALDVYSLIILWERAVLATSIPINFDVTKHYYRLFEQIGARIISLMWYYI